MDAVEYEKMAEVEDSMWWYQGLHRNLLLVLRRWCGGRAVDLLDLGCGTGGFLSRALTAVPSARSFGLDAWRPACAATRSRSARPVVRGVADRIPLAGACLDALVSADVLCHRSVDPGRAVREAFRCLRPGGILVLSLPAYQWMHSYHDVRVQTVRRFTRGSVMRLLREAGFVPEYATYWNTLLFPIMMLLRLLFRSSAKESDVHPYPAPLEACFRAVMAVEGGFLRAGGRFPFGGSILVAAVKPHG